MDRAKIGTDNDSIRVFVCEIYGPDARPSADVENALRGIRNWCSEEVAIQCLAKNVVTEIEAILLELIIGQNIGTFAVGVAATTILALVVQD